ncbi:MAG: 50S ribosomal protein L15 [Chthonomonadales bacterium]|nr:50S ribosomal protein L15 [Chthonomonadales bacterium]
MQLHDLGPAAGATHRPKKVGRGMGSGKGKTCGRGSKGQKARNKVALGFEGGHTPLHRRLPQARGFKPVNRVEYAVVNVAALEQLDPAVTITPEQLYELGMLRSASERLKVLGDGELTKPVNIQAHKFSAAAVQKIEAAGGKAETIPYRQSARLKER